MSDSAPDRVHEAAPVATDSAGDAPGGSAAPPPAEPTSETRKSWGFPAFAADFPPDAELSRLVAAFAAGDYAAVRSGAPALAAATTNEDVKRAAVLLRARIEPDPSSRLFFGLTAALLVFLFAWWATHDGAEHAGPAPAKPPRAVEYVH
jgi:hypothetical protein